MVFFPVLLNLLVAHGHLVSGYDLLYARAVNYTGPFADGGSWADGFAKAKALVDQMVGPSSFFVLNYVDVLPRPSRKR